MSSYFIRNDKMTPLEGQINAVLHEMERVGVNSPDYPVLMTHLERLNEMKLKSNQKSVSRDTIALIIGNLMGILIIVAYEQKHVMTSKGFNQIIRPR